MAAQNGYKVTRERQVSFQDEEPKVTRERTVSFQEEEPKSKQKEPLSTLFQDRQMSVESGFSDDLKTTNQRAVTVPSFPVAGKKPKFVPERVSRFQFTKQAAETKKAPEEETRGLLTPPLEEEQQQVVTTAFPPRGGGNLAHFEDTWHIMTNDVEATMPKDAVISDCRVDTSRSEYANTTEEEDNLVCAPATFADRDAPKAWRSKSLISFDYRVVEVPRGQLLDPKCDALLFGHLDYGSGEREEAMRRPQRRLVVIDETVNELYGAKVRAYFEAWGSTYKVLVLPLTEENKSVENTLKVCEEMKKFNIDRRLEPVIAIGGGVCLDVVGLAASLFRRRTPYIRVPTTSLSYVDASVGAKNGCNFCGSKNRLGTYVPPCAALLDSSFFQTQRPRDISNSLGEMCKMAIMKSPELFELLEKNGPRLIEGKFAANGPDDHAPARVLRLSIESMMEELAPNLWEHCLDRLVDFGHAVGQDLEMKALGTEYELMHGEAVATDMAFMTCLAEVMGQLSTTDRDRILALLRVCSVPTHNPLFTREFFNEAIKGRVANSMGQRLPLPVGIGKARIFNDVDEETFERTFVQWEALCARAPQPPRGPAPPPMTAAELAKHKQPPSAAAPDLKKKVENMGGGVVGTIPDALLGA